MVKLRLETTLFGGVCVGSCGSAKALSTIGWPRELGKLAGF